MEKKNELLSMIMDEKEIRWQSIIYDLVRSGKIDPWDVDISTFSNEFLKTLETLKEMNFLLSGKVVLAAAILLKMKTNRLGLDEFLELIEEDADELEEAFEDFGIEEEVFSEEDANLQKLAETLKVNKAASLSLEPNLDRKKSRKVTVFELVSALRKAIDVDDRRSEKKRSEKKDEEKPPKFEIEKFDIRSKIGEVYNSILHYIKVQKSNTIEFSKIVPSKDRKDMIWTFVPLLHLAHDGRIGLSQQRHFDEIYVEMFDSEFHKKINKSERGK